MYVLKRVFNGPPTWNHAKNSQRTALEEPSYVRRHRQNKDVSLKLPRCVGCFFAALKLFLPHPCMLCGWVFCCFEVLLGCISAASRLPLRCFCAALCCFTVVPSCCWTVSALLLCRLCIFCMPCNLLGSVLGPCWRVLGSLDQEFAKKVPTKGVARFWAPLHVYIICR